MDNEKVIKVMIVCEDITDSPSLNGLLAGNSNFELVCQSHSFADALQRCKEFAPDIVLFIPDSHGEKEVEFIRTIVRDYPLCQCIMISTPPSNADWAYEVTLAGCRYWVNTPWDAASVYRVILEAYQALEVYRKR